MDEASTGNPVRPWRVVAEEASRECDPTRMIALIKELNQALEEQGLREASDMRTEKKTA